MHVTRAILDIMQETLRNCMFKCTQKLSLPSNDCHDAAA
jgi:hypothetical protein